MTVSDGSNENDPLRQTAAVDGGRLERVPTKSRETRGYRMRTPKVAAVAIQPVDDRRRRWRNEACGEGPLRRTKVQRRPHERRRRSETNV